MNQTTHPPMKTSMRPKTSRACRLLARGFKLLFIVLAVGLMGAAPRVGAATLQWNRTSGSMNWTTAANWTAPQQTFFNQVQFLGRGTNNNATLTVNSILDATTGTAQMPMWELNYYNTNGNYVTQINPGVTMQVAAGNGKMYVGAPGGPANAVQIIKFTGSGGTLSLNPSAAGSLVGALTVQQSSATPGTHNVTLDLSELGNFQLNAGANNRLLVAATGNRSHGTLYLAKTNLLLVTGDITIGSQGTTSNSLPVALYLGVTNAIYTGSGNNYLVVGQSGASNAIFAFNPAVRNTTPPAQAYIASTAAGNRGNLWVAANQGSPNHPAYGIFDLSGGKVTVLEDSIQLGQGGNTAIARALGVLTFDNGVIDANTVVAGNQTASSGGMGAGIINVLTNATLGANAILNVNNSLTLAAVTGVLTPGSAGTLNINGGVVNADVIASGGGAATITVNNGRLATRTAGTAANSLTTLAVTNSALQVKINSATATNIVVNSLITGGAANAIDLLSLPSVGSYPYQVTVIRYAGAIGGAGYNFVLGSIPLGAVGYLSNNIANGSIDVVMTDGPRTLAWTGAQNNNWDTTALNWQAGIAMTYNDGSFVNFLDGATTAAVNLTAALQPGGITVSNTSPDYTFSGSGQLGGSAELVKRGSGKLTIANSGVNSFTGTTTIEAGTLQIGANDGNGNLPAGGNVINNGALIFARNDGITVSSLISGPGSLNQTGGGSLFLSGVNSFSGPLSVASGSTLRIGNVFALGTSAGATTIANGATLDANGFNLGSEPIVVSGTGVGGSGAIINSGGDIYSSGGGLTANLTLAGDTTISFAYRMDFGSPSGGAINSGGQPYNLTLVGDSGIYFEWRRLTVPDLGNISMMSGSFGVVGSTTLGNPNHDLYLAPGAIMALYADDTPVSINKRVVIDGATIQNGFGANLINGPVTLTGGFCLFEVGSTSLTLGGALTGDGTLYKSGASALVLTGNSPAFAGGAYILGGALTVNGTLNNPQGVTLADGRLNLNGTLLGGSVTSFGGTTVAGSGSATSGFDIGGGLLPGNAGVIGTLAVGDLILQGGATLTNDLAATAAGVSDLVQVNGNLTANGNMIYVNPVGGTLENGRAYTLLTYTGTLNGSFGGVATVSSSSYTFVLTNVTTTSPKMIQAIVTGGQPSVLVWNNASGSGQWDVQGSANWTNRTTHVSPDVFYSFDAVVFDNTISSSPTPTTTITIPDGQVVQPSSITNNSTLNYTFTGEGRIGGGGNLTKLGSSTLTINTTNSDYIGNVNLLGGAIVISNASALGTANGTVTIASGTKLELNGFGLGATKPYVLAGFGPDGNGALVNNGGPIYKDAGSPAKITLTGDVTFGGSGRIDLGSTTGGTMGTDGSVRNISIVGNTYREWFNLVCDTNIGDINVYEGEFGVAGTTTLGDPTKTVTVYGGATMTFWGGSGYGKNYYISSGATMNVRYDGPLFNLNLTLEEGSTFNSWNNAKTLTAPVTLLGVAHFQIGDNSCTFSNVISGPGGFHWDNGSVPFIFAASNTYTGPTILTGTGLRLVGVGSISHSANIQLNGGASVDVSGRPDGTLALANGQTLTLAAGGTINGSLSALAGSTIALDDPALVTLTVTNAATLAGNAKIVLNKSGSPTRSQIAAATIQYGGTLTLVNLGPALVAGDSFKIFTASTGNYTGAFGGIVPATPGAGLQWDTSSLNVDGTLKVVVGTVSQPSIASVTLAAGNIILQGTNGPANGTYWVLTSTDVALPLANWTPLATNQFSGSGTFSFTNAVNPGDPRRFYLLQVP